jgi:hypothetical protein
MIAISGCTGTTQCIRVTPEAKYLTDNGHGVIVLNDRVYEVASTSFYNEIEVNKSIDIRFNINTRGSTEIWKGDNC